MLTSRKILLLRKKAIVIYTIIGLTAIALATHWNVVVAAAEGDGGGGNMIVDILVDGSTSTGPGTAFHVQGPIYPAGTFEAEGCTPTVDPIGILHCWGYKPATGGPGVVSQEWEFFGLGKIQCQGREGPGVSIAVVGGTGKFRNARGERLWVAQALCPDSPAPGNPGATIQLTVEFDLTVQTVL